MSAWRKSTYSSGNGDNCVEVAATNKVLIRDTTDRAGCTLSIAPSAWTAFLATIW